MEREIEEVMEELKEYNEIVVNYLNMMYELERNGASKQELENYQASLETILEKEKRKYQSLDDELVEEILKKVTKGEVLFKENGIIKEWEQFSRMQKQLRAVLYMRELEKEPEDSEYLKQEMLRRVPVKELNYNYEQCIQRMIEAREPENSLREDGLKAKYKHQYYQIPLKKYLFDRPTLQMPYRDYVRASKEEQENLLEFLGISKEELLDAYQNIGMRVAKKALKSLKNSQQKKVAMAGVYSVDAVITIQSLLPILSRENKEEIVTQLENIKPSRYTRAILKAANRQEQEKKRLGYYPIVRKVGQIPFDNQKGKTEEGR